MLAVVLAAVPAARPLAGCTLWGAAGEVAGGGTVIAKNRDWKPDHIQVLKLRPAEKGYAYFGLYAEGNDEPGLKSGVNQAGLTVVTATAGSIPKKSRDTQPGKRGVLATLLGNYATCEEIVAKQDALFSRARAGFFLIADRRQILAVEVGLDGKFAVRAVNQGTLAHTNHFLERSLAEYNVKIGRSSATRLDRITELVRECPPPYDTAAYARMSRDQHAGPDNSLWRTGKDARTLASWVVETPAEGAPRLRVLLANPGQPEAVHTFVLDEKFWRGGK